MIIEKNPFTYERRNHNAALVPNAPSKVILDYMLAIFLLAALSPVFAGVAISIKSESVGPVFFRQPRIGRNGRLFMIWKFRTMLHDRSESSLDGRCQAKRSDVRVTRVGRLLRKYSIDELPQLINVIRGEMSLVGPRPHPLKVHVGGLLFQEVVADYEARHRVRPGITGWAQVNGWRGETTMVEQIEQRVEHDLYYIQHWSIAFDVRILLLTLLRGFVDENAF